VCEVGPGEKIASVLPDSREVEVWKPQSTGRWGVEATLSTDPKVLASALSTDPKVIAIASASPVLGLGPDFHDATQFQDVDWHPHDGRIVTLNFGAAIVWKVNNSQPGHWYQQRIIRFRLLPCKLLAYGSSPLRRTVEKSVGAPATSSSFPSLGQLLAMK